MYHYSEKLDEGTVIFVRTLTGNIYLRLLQMEIIPILTNLFHNFDYFTYNLFLFIDMKNSIFYFLKNICGSIYSSLWWSTSRYVWLLCSVSVPTWVLILWEFFWLSNVFGKIFSSVSECLWSASLTNLGWYFVNLYIIMVSSNRIRLL